MKELHDRELLQHYLQLYQLESIFPEKLLPHLSLYTYEQGELICSQGDEASYLYVLVKGKLKICTTSEEGKTFILSFKSPLELICDIEFVQQIPIINTVEAITSVSMIGIHYDWIRKFGSDHAPLLQFLLKVITNKFCVKSENLRVNLMYPVEIRLASYLLSISFDESDSDFKGQLRSSHIPDTANLLGTSYRHLNRVIRKFCTEGLVERTKDAIIVKDRDGLSAIANENIFR